MNMAGVERIRYNIRGVKVVGESPIKRYMEAIYNGAATRHGVELKLTIMPLDEDWRSAERSGPAGEGARDSA